MKKFGWTMFGACVGMSVSATLISSASAQEGMVTLFGDAPKGARSGSNWQFTFEDPKSGKTVGELAATVTVRDGRYFAEVGSKELDPGRLYAVTVTGEGGVPLEQGTFVTLQGSTPGVPETGNINVTGTIIAGKIALGNGAPMPYLINANTTSTVGGLFGSSNGNGIRGVTTSTTPGYAGGSFKASAADSYGVYSLNSGATGNAYAGYFRTSSDSGIALNAVNDNVSGLNGVRFGVHAEVTAASLLNDGSAGIRGVVNNVEPGASLVMGVHGILQGNAPPLGYGVFSTGESGGTGLKTFLIDHPQDPANKLLRHYSIEGAEPLLVYSGTVRLDPSGGAVVVLPSYWASVNTDPRYQLTAVGAAMPSLHVASEVSGNKFRIAGGVPNGKVSWTVSGTRNDPYVRRVGIRDVIEKSSSMKGRYFHPVLYGEPESRAFSIPPTHAGNRAEK